MGLDKSEFKAVFDDHFDAIRRFVYFRCGDQEKASDMAQDIFMKVWEKREVMVGSNIKSLLYKMANDMVISDIRKDIVRQNYAKSFEMNDLEMSAHEQMQFKETAQKYATALSEMSENLRITFLMNRNEELTYVEIANMLNISVKAVEKRMSQALQFLRERLLSVELLVLLIAMALK